MINIHEFRLGNWITIDGKPNNVGQIKNNFYGVEINGIGEAFFNSINPIPLTPELLEKCGFVDTSGGYRATGSEVVYRVQSPLNGKNIDLWECDGGFQMPHYEVVLKYLHELQNWFRFNTGHELTINL